MRRSYKLAAFSFACAGLLSACGVSSFVSHVPADATTYSGSNGTGDAEGKPLPPVETNIPNPIPVLTEPEVDPSSKVPSVVDTTLYFDKTVTAAGDQKINNGALHIKIDNAVLGSKTESILEKPPLSIVFAIDRSSSMGRELETVKQGVQSFSDKLLKSGFSANFGVVAFQDSIDSVQEIGMFDAFKSHVNGITLAAPYPNYDIPEGSIAALNKAYQMLEMQAVDPKVVPVIVLLTDAVGHQGGRGDDIYNRNCSPMSFLSRMDSDFGKRVIFFHASSSADPRVIPQVRERCPWVKVSDQYNQILKALKAKTPMGFRGEALAWPFNEDVLTNQLPNILVTKLTQKELTCEVTSADLKLDGTSIKSWTQSDLMVDMSGTILLSNAVTEDKTLSFDQKSVVLDVKRCCEKNADMSCKTPRDQTVNFTLKMTR